MAVSSSFSRSRISAAFDHGLGALGERRLAHRTKACLPQLELLLDLRFGSGWKVLITSPVAGLIVAIAMMAVPSSEIGRDFAHFDPRPLRFRANWKLISASDAT